MNYITKLKTFLFGIFSLYLPHLQLALKKIFNCRWLQKDKLIVPKNQCQREQLEKMLLENEVVITTV